MEALGSRWGRSHVDVGHLGLGDCVCSVGVVLAGTWLRLDSVLTLLADSKGLDIGVETDSIVVLARGNVNITSFMEAFRSGRGGAHVNVSHFGLGDGISSLRRVGSRSHSFGSSLLALLANLERLDIRVPPLAIVVLAWTSASDLSLVSEGVGSGLFVGDNGSPCP